MTAKTEKVSARYRFVEPSNVEQLAKRMMEDDQFLFGLLVIKALIKGAQVTVSCESPTVRADAIAKHLQNVWHSNIEKFLHALEYGRQALEKVFKFDHATGYQIAELNDIPFSRSKMVIENGLFAGVKVEDIELNSEESAWFSIRPTSTEPHGRSIFLGAPQRVFRLRQEHEKREEIWYKRFSIGRGVGRAPSEYGVNNAQGAYGQVDASGRQSSPMYDLQRSLESIEAGGELILPYDVDQNGNQRWDYQPGNDLKDGTAFENRRRMLDAMALRSLGIPERALTQDGATGSRAVADAHGQVMYDVIESYLSDLIESFQTHIVEPIERYNGLPEGSLIVNYRSLSDRSEQRIEEAIRAALAGSAISPVISSGMLDVKKMLEMNGYPIGQNSDQALVKLQGLLAPPAPSPAPFAFQLAHRFAETCVERRLHSAT